MSWSFFPTPYHPFDLKLSGLDALWIKRDDLTGLAGGGNKTRKLVGFLSHIESEGYDALVTEGAPQSNHCRQTAAMAAARRIPATLVLGGTGSQEPVGNVLLDEILGARLVFCESQLRTATVDRVMSELREQGLKPFHIPVGGSSPIGVHAYAEAITEWATQQRELGWWPDVIVHASSSGGTQAGLALGLARLDNAPTHVLGISVDHSAGELRTIVEGLLDQSVGDVALREQAKAICQYNSSYLGLGYARPSQHEARAIRFVAQNTGIVADPVYTGRGLVGLLDLAERGQFDGKRVVFWHTGGLPSIHAFGSPSGWPSLPEEEG